MIWKVDKNFSSPPSISLIFWDVQLCSYVFSKRCSKNPDAVWTCIMDIKVHVHRYKIGSERIFVCKMIRKWWKKPNKTKGWHLQAFQKILNVAIDIVFTSASLAGWREDCRLNVKGQLSRLTQILSWKYDQLQIRKSESKSWRGVILYSQIVF